mgnify:CR=1 FL=1
MHQYAAYTDEGIWETGDSAEDVLSRYYNSLQLDPDDDAYPAPLVAPMTDRLAAKVDESGYDACHPAYNWRVLGDGTLDLNETEK